MHRKPAIRTVLGALLVLAAAAAGRPAAAQTIERDGQRVEVQVSSHSGASTAVCLESAAGVRGRKRLGVWYGSGTARLSTTGNDHGPHCAFFDPQGPRFSVRLEYSHLVLLTAILADREFDREEMRGKTITFRWVAE